MGALGPTELIIIFFIILLLFGAKKLPELARGLGKGIKEFQSASKEISDEIRNATYEDRSPRQSSRPQKNYEPNDEFESGDEPQDTSDEVKDESEK
jgi:sec-independent protein translocase protein TatA